DDEDDDEEDDMDYGVVRGIMKPDITFFGEKLPDQFDEALLEDRDQVDLLLVMGSSLKVAPVSDIMSHLPHNIPQVVINKTPILHLNFDVQLLGDADDIVAFLARECGWELRHEKIPGGSTGSKEFMDNRRCPVAEEKGRCVAVPVKVKEEGGAVSVGERKLEVPAHWHLFESAVVTPRDLLAASGEERVRLAEEESSDDDDDDDNEDEDEDEDVSDGEAA
ncbi:NAD-dependent histone deacetylase sir2, partial [Kickxella alabastrina]